MRRLAALIAFALVFTACSTNYFESPDFGPASPGQDVVLWRLAAGPAGIVGIGGPIQPADLEEGADPISLAPYLTSDGTTWASGNPLGSVEAPLIGLTAWEGGYAASGAWDGEPAVLTSSDGLSWERHVLPGPAGLELESAGIAAAGGVVIVTGWAGDPVAPLLWRIDETGAITEIDPGFPESLRPTQAIAGPAGFVVAVAPTTVDSEPPPIWISTDGSEWSPVLDPFDGDRSVTGLVGSDAGYVAVVAEEGDDERFGLWTSTDAIDWTLRADQDSVFTLLSGKQGDLLADLLGTPIAEAEARPIAFAFDGRWMEITEAVDGNRFVTVAVAAGESFRLISGFMAGDEPSPLVLLAGG